MRKAVAAAVAVAVAVGIAAPLARASPPPAKPLLVDVDHGAIGGVRLGDPILRFWMSWRRSVDSTVTHPAGPLAIWTNGDSRAPNWAAVRFDDAQQHAASIFYAGPLGTARGDRIGTPLSAFLQHWPSHTPVHAAPDYPRCSIVTVRGIRFLFDPRKWLFAVALGDDTAVNYWSTCHRS